MDAEDNVEALARNCLDPVAFLTRGRLLAEVEVDRAVRVRAGGRRRDR